jgi:hypothetical protein
MLRSDDQGQPAKWQWPFRSVVCNDDSRIPHNPLLGMLLYSAIRYRSKQRFVVVVFFYMDMGSYDDLRDNFIGVD